MSNRHQLESLAQIAALTPEQFGRMLPDFIAWYEFMQSIKGGIVTTTGFEWVDDGRPGEISAVSITELETGKRHEFIIAGFEGGAV